MSVPSSTSSTSTTSFADTFLPGLAAGAVDAFMSAENTRAPIIVGFTAAFLSGVQYQTDNKEIVLKKVGVLGVFVALLSYAMRATTSNATVRAAAVAIVTPFLIEFERLGRIFPQGSQ